MMLMAGSGVGIDAAICPPPTAALNPYTARSIAQASHQDLLALAAEDGGAALDLLLVGARVPGDRHADVRLAAQQVGVGTEVMHEHLELAFGCLSDLVALRAV